MVLTLGRLDYLTLGLVFGSNMKKALHIASVFIGLFIVFSFSNPEKKIQKLISKIWKETELTLQTIELENAIENVSQINIIQSNGIDVGYACYTYSHGCKVGGCSAPSKDVDDSYEVFEYIVIYDNDMNILKVDIANYGGEYGYEICRTKWLKQFKGQRSGFVLGGNVDGISGATVSATYLIDDLNKLGITMVNLQQKKLL